MPSAPRTHRPRAHEVLAVDRKLNDRKRRNSNARGYTYRWSLASKAYLAAHPLCAHCFAKGLIEAATAVDHIIPHRGDKSLFWRQSNWQPLCAPCHSRKTGQGL